MHRKRLSPTSLIHNSTLHEAVHIFKAQSRRLTITMRQLKRLSWLHIASLGIVYCHQSSFNLHLGTQGYWGNRDMFHLPLPSSRGFKKQKKRKWCDIFNCNKGLPVAEMNNIMWHSMPIKLCHLNYIVEWSETRIAVAKVVTEKKTWTLKKTW